MKKGFTVIELMIGIAIAGIFAAIAVFPIFNNRGATEKRALEAARSFVEENGIEVARMTCAGDSDGDGYGTCNIRTKGGEKIILQCPTDFLDTKVFGACNCKEVIQVHNLQIDH